MLFFWLLILLIIILLCKIIYDIYMRPNQEVIVAFDMDETLGHFVEFSIFCEILENIKNRKLKYSEFKDALDMYPEFLRPNILTILNFVKKKKQNGECDRVVIYTNNQGPKDWAQFIAKYLEEKIKYKLFDKIIGAYKVGNIRNEARRTSHEKKVSDFSTCCNTNINSKICFIDDQNYDGMRQENVYYINPKPYVYIIPYGEMAERFYIKHPRSVPNHDSWINFVVKSMKESNYHRLDYQENNPLIDIKFGKDALLHLQRFFKSVKQNKTRKCSL